MNEPKMFILDGNMTRLSPYLHTPKPEATHVLQVEGLVRCRPCTKPQQEKTHP